MTRKQKSILSATAALVVAAGITTMVVHHHEPVGAPSQRVKADVMSPQPVLTEAQITEALQQANLPIDRLSVRNVGGIVLVRGNGDAASSARAVEVVKSLGFSRVANLVQPTTAFDDESLRREAERQLASNRSLDGCTLHVSCERGVLSVSGRVQNELQEDVTRSVLRTVRGAQDVKVTLSRS
jgi:osmotically-inducible protein OsmY